MRIAFAWRNPAWASCAANGVGLDKTTGMEPHLLDRKRHPALFGRATSLVGRGFSAHRARTGNFGKERFTVLASFDDVSEECCLRPKAPLLEVKK